MDLSPAIAISKSNGDTLGQLIALVNDPSVSLSEQQLQAIARVGKAIATSNEELRALHSACKVLNQIAEDVP